MVRNRQIAPGPQEEHIIDIPENEHDANGRSIYHLIEIHRDNQWKSDSPFNRTNAVALLVALIIFALDGIPEAFNIRRAKDKEEERAAGISLTSALVQFLVFYVALATSFTAWNSQYFKKRALKRDIDRLVRTDYSWLEAGHVLARQQGWVRDSSLVPKNLGAVYERVLELKQRLDEHIEENAKHDPVYYLCASYLEYRLGLYEKSLLDIQHHLLKAKDTPFALYLKANIYFSMGKNESAADLKRSYFFEAKKIFKYLLAPNVPDKLFGLLPDAKAVIQKDLARLYCLIGDSSVRDERWGWYHRADAHAKESLRLLSEQLPRVNDGMLKTLNLVRANTRLNQAVIYERFWEAEHAPLNHEDYTVAIEHCQRAREVPEALVWVTSLEEEARLILKNWQNTFDRQDRSVEETTNLITQYQQVKDLYTELLLIFEGRKAVVNGQALPANLNAQLTPAMYSNALMRMSTIHGHLYFLTRVDSYRDEAARYYQLATGVNRANLVAYNQFLDFCKSIQDWPAYQTVEREFLEIFLELDDPGAGTLYLTRAEGVLAHPDTGDDEGLLDNAASLAHIARTHNTGYHFERGVAGFWRNFRQTRPGYFVGNRGQLHPQQ